MRMTRAEAERLAEGVPKEPYYAGRWRVARSAEAFDVVDPVTEGRLATVAEAGPVEVDEAVSAARSAVAEGPWRRTGGTGRARLLNRVADLLEARSEEFAALESLDVGKPRFEPRAIDLPQAVRTFRHFAGWADK